jgi:hypothetical protein
MDMIEGYGDDQPEISLQCENERRERREGSEESEGRERMEGNEPRDGPPATTRARAFAASLPARFRPSSVTETACDEQDIDPTVVAVVRKWLELKESRGMVITQDLRRRHWYKSPDMMVSMLHKFGIDDRGTLLDVDKRGLKTRDEARALWAGYEERRSKEKAKERASKRNEKNSGGGGSLTHGQPKIEFTKQVAVQAALQAAREHAAKSGGGHRIGGGKDDGGGKRRKR